MTDNEIRYTEFLEHQNKQLKKENEILKNRDNLSKKLDETFAKSDEGYYMSYGILKEENEKLKDELKEANKDVGCYIGDMDILKQENAALRDDKYKYIELYKQKLDETGQLKEELSDVTKVKDHFAKQAYSLGKENTKLKEQNLEIRNDIGKLKNDLWCVEGELGIADKENSKLKSQRDNWEKEYYEVVEENDRQDEYITQLKQDLKNKIDDMKSLSDKYDNMYQECIKKHKQVVELKEKIYDMSVKESRLSQILNETS